MTRVYDPTVVAKACEPNLSPVVSERTFVDFDGAECDYTTHADGSVTIVAQRLATNTRAAGDGEE